MLTIQGASVVLNRQLVYPGKRAEPPEPSTVLVFKLEASGITSEPGGSVVKRKRYDDSEQYSCQVFLTVTRATDWFEYEPAKERVEALSRVRRAARMNFRSLDNGRSGRGEPVKPLRSGQKPDRAILRATFADLYDSFQVLLQDVHVDMWRSNRPDSFPVQYVACAEKIGRSAVQDDSDIPEDAELYTRNDPYDGVVVIVPVHVWILIHRR